MCEDQEIDWVLENPTAEQVQKAVKRLEVGIKELSCLLLDNPRILFTMDLIAENLAVLPYDGKNVDEEIDDLEQLSKRLIVTSCVSTRQANNAAKFVRAILRLQRLLETVK